MKDPTVPQDVKNYAAMVSMVDNDLRQVLELLDELKLSDNTIVFFTGDNGGQDRFKNKQFPRGFFGPNVNPVTGVEFRGGKGNLYEGGLRIPFLVRWPGKIPAGRVSDLLFYQPDVLPTLAELTGSTPPDDIDGLSILPELFGVDRGNGAQQHHDFLYWEFGSQTAVRVGNMKAIRPGKNAAWELYDLSTDLSETTDVSAKYAEQLETMKRLAEEAHRPVQPGTFRDSKRVRHERDRAAKWGSVRNDVRAAGMNRIREKGLVPFDEMKVVRFSSENRGNDRQAIHAVDGRPNTVWHSQFSGGPVAKHPHELVIDLGGVHRVTGFRYLSRQDGGWNGAFAKTLYSVSDTLDNFGEPVATATHGKTRAVQRVDLSEPVVGRYVRIQVLSEVNGNEWASAADIAVAGKRVLQ